jgi:tetratricopeptide (TPR) repeat protein
MVNALNIKVSEFKTGLLSFIIFALCFILYGNTIPNHYSLDDELVSYNNKRIAGGIKAIPAIWSTFYSEGKLKYEYRPVVKTTFAIEYQFFGQNPHVSHLINILLYALTALLLFKILRKLFASYSTLLAFTAIILFVAHPVHTEVVASLKNRDELLSFLGCIISLWFLLKYADSSKLEYLLFAFISYILAYFSKSSAIVFVAVFPLVLYFYGKTSIKKIMLAFVIILIAMIAARFIPKALLPAPNRDVFFFENPLFFYPSLVYKIPMGILSLLFYIKILIYPHPLVFYYGYNMIPMVSLYNPVVIVTAIMLLILFIYSLFGIKKRHVLSFSILYFFVTISLFSNIFKPAMGIVAERYVYASSLGFCLAIAFLLLKLLKIETIQNNILKKDWIKILIPLFIILIPFSAKTVSRNPNWNTHMSLYLNDIKYLNKSGKSNALIASQMMQDVNTTLNSGIVPNNLKEKADSIILFYNNSIKVLPSYYSSYNNIGTIYITMLAPFENDSSKQREIYSKAIWYFKESIKFKPLYFDALYNLGFTYEKLGNYKQSVKYYNKAAVLDSSYIKSWSNMANIYNDYLNNMDSAIILNQTIMKIAPASDIPYVNIGTYYLMRSDSVNAMKSFETASIKVPSNKVIAELLYYYFKDKDKVKAEKYRVLANIPVVTFLNK